MADTTREAQINAIKQLMDCDHAFLSEEGVRRITEPFGFKGRVSRQYANPRDPKGLTFHNGAKSAVGQDAQIVAIRICNHASVHYERKLGRGSQLHACCSAMLDHLNATEEERTSPTVWPKEQS
jgi:hypothetical protein